MKIAEFAELIDYHGNVEKVLLSANERRELLLEIRDNIYAPADYISQRLNVFGVEVVASDLVEKYEIVYLQCKNCGGRSWESRKCKYCNK